VSGSRRCPVARRVLEALPSTSSNGPERPPRTTRCSTVAITLQSGYWHQACWGLSAKHHVPPSGTSRGAEQLAHGNLKFMNTRAPLHGRRRRWHRCRRAHHLQRCGATSERRCCLPVAGGFLDRGGHPASSTGSTGRWLWLRGAPQRRLGWDPVTASGASLGLRSSVSQGSVAQIWVDRSVTDCVGARYGTGGSQWHG
jgi:hypothetical protein